jgi:arsenate reductase
MSEKIYNVLFLCTGNSARSILAEAIVNRRGGSRFRGFSAGSHPNGEVHPMALALLRERGDDATGLRSKRWDEFAAPGAPVPDFVITVCEDAAAETCPIWPGRPLTAHWGVEDPVAFEGPVDRQRQLFRRVYQVLERRIDLFTSLSFESLDRIRLQERLAEIGKSGAREREET